MRAIVTVLGKDRVGIMSLVCALLAQHNVNILDISQTILQGDFTMVMLVDAGGRRRLRHPLRRAGRPARAGG